LHYFRLVLYICTAHTGLPLVCVKDNKTQQNAGLNRVVASRENAGFSRVVAAPKDAGHSRVPAFRANAAF